MHTNSGKGAIQQWSEGTESLAESDREAILEAAFGMFASSSSPAVGADPGRGEIGIVALVDGQRAIVRKFFRGGALSWILKDQFFKPTIGPYPVLPTGAKLTGYRPFDELKVLDFLSSEQISVPVPIAALIFERALGFTYKGVIALREICGARNLLSVVSAGSEEKLGEVAFAVGLQARKILNLGIRHADLHLGNVLVNESEDVYLIDFDKASVFDPAVELERSRLYLVQRWSRSCRKHARDDLIQPFREGLLDG